MHTLCVVSDVAVLHGLSYRPARLARTAGLTFSRVPEVPRAPSGVRAFFGVIRSRLLAAAAAASAAAALTAAASSAFGVGLLGLGAFVSVMPALPAVVAFDVLQGLLLAALLLPGQNNSTAALPESSVAEALYAAERCPTCPRGFIP